MKRIHLLPYLLLLSLLCTCVVQRSPVTGKKRAYAYTWKQEIEIGREADIEIQQQYGIYDDPELSKYVNKIGQEVLARSDLQSPEALDEYKNTRFTFRVLNSPVVNAFALPGGYIYVTRGLLAYLENEAQLAVILGHEISHVAARHSSQKAFQESVGQIALIGGAIVGEQVLGISGQDILNIGGTAAKLLFLRYSRDDEREADRLGVEYAAKAGYKTSEASRFFTSLKRISQQQENTLPSLLSTHPDPGDREKNINKLSDEWINKGLSMSFINEQKYMEEINGLIFGENPREGFFENGIFYHPGLKFRFPVPAGWTMYNEASQVVFISENQDAVMLFQADSKSDSPANSVSAFLNQQGITVIEKGVVPQSAYQAYKAVAKARTQNNEMIGLYIYALRYNNRVYRFIDYTTENKYESFEPVFALSGNRFSPITNSKILNIQPVRIKVVRLEKSEKFSNLLPKQLPENITPEDIAIMNQAKLSGFLPGGFYLKLPGN